MIKKIIWNIELLSHYFQEVEQFFDLRQKRKIVNIIGEIMETSTEGKTEVAIANSPKEFVTQDIESTIRKIEPDNTYILDLISKELPNEAKIGYMLPLNCGHNSNLSLAELNLVQKHLINAQIVELADSP